MDSKKPVHSLVLDTGPIIKNEPAVSTLLSQAEELFTVPAIISEIKDNQTRARVQTTLLPFLTIRSPTPRAVKIVSDFARRTGDLAVLSRPDIEIIALTYDLECERNNGDWRLRNTPGQKTLNGSPPDKTSPAGETVVGSHTAASTADPTAHLADKLAATSLSKSDEIINPVEPAVIDEEVAEADAPASALGPAKQNSVASNLAPASGHAGEVTSSSTPHVSANSETASAPEGANGEVQEDEASASDSDGWITPSNLKRQQAKDSAGSTAEVPEPAVMQAAVLTSDFAMQNVSLQMNVNLLSSSLQRVKQLKTFVQRCHACFQVCKDMNKQFCPRCGQPALTRVACSTNSKGEFKLHLKQNMQWNKRGDRYSVPKPAHGSTNGRVTGGGKGGWGHDLILTEDQKEYERARVVERKQKERSLMDEDYLPSILTGDRSRAGGRIKVGAGKNVNSRKRHD